MHLLGRRLYETMRYWETAAADPTLSDLEREFAALWTAMPKVVFSVSLTEVEDGYRLADGELAAEVERWRAEPGRATSPSAARRSLPRPRLVDEYRLRVHPVLVGGGTPFFPRAERREDLDLVDCRTIGSGVVHLRYRVRR